MNMRTPAGKLRTDRPDGRLFLTDENLDRGALILLAAARRIEVRLRQAVADTGLTPLQLSILMELSHAPGIDVSELRARVGGTTPTIARILAELEKAGWLIRPKSDGDGRRRALRLSEAGNALIDDALASVRKDLTHVYRQAGEPSVSGALEVLDAMTEIPAEARSL